MKQLLSIFLIFSLLACKNKSERTFVLPSDDEINSIIEAVIYQDSLPVFKDYKHFNSGRTKPDTIAIDLRKIILTFPTTGVPPPPTLNSTPISMLDLLSPEVSGKEFFNKSDSSYIIYQNKHLKSFVIAKSISSKLLVTTYSRELKKWETKYFIQYYDLSIPILSTDKKKAYVEITYNCSGLCGSGKAVYLEKINNKWIIISSEMTWIS